MTDPIRLDKRLTSLIGCSRGDAQRYIEGGWVTVDGTVVEQPQTLVTDETIVLRDNAEATRTETVSMLLHKPAGMRADELCALVTPDSHSELDATGVTLLQRHFHALQLVMPLPTKTAAWSSSARTAASCPTSRIAAPPSNRNIWSKSVANWRPMA